MVEKTKQNHKHWANMRISTSRRCGSLEWFTGFPLCCAIIF